MRWAMTRLNMHASLVKFSNSVNIMGTVIVVVFFYFFCINLLENYPMLSSIVMWYSHICLLPPGGNILNGGFSNGDI